MSEEEPAYPERGGKLIRVHWSVLKDIDAWWQRETACGVFGQVEFVRGLSRRQREGWTGKLMLLVQEAKRLKHIVEKRQARVTKSE